MKKWPNNEVFQCFEKNYYCLLIIPWNIKWYWSVSSCINPISGKFFFWSYWWKGSQWIILQDSLMRFGHRKTSMSYVQISDFEKSATKSFKLLPKRFWWIEDIFFILTLSQHNLEFWQKEHFHLKMVISAPSERLRTV